MMSGRAHTGSARRGGDRVTALLRDQPFFGSLALRLPIRAGASRETLPGDDEDIRHSPRRRRACPIAMFRGHGAGSECFHHATAPRPFFATRVKSFSEAPRGRFSPRSH